MNYQQKRHYELILANNLRGPANEYKRLAEEARHITVVTRTLSQQVLGHEDGTLEEVSAEIDKVLTTVRSMNRARQLPASKEFEFEPDESSYPAKKKGRR